MIQKLYAFVAFIMLFTLISCNEDEYLQVPELENKELLRIIEESGNKGLPFPEGTKVEKKDDETFTLTLPKGFKYAYYSIASDGKISPYLEFTDTANVTCSCTNGTGCSPVKVKGEYYCVMNSDCKSCNLSTSKILNKSKTEIKIVGLINESIGISFISDEKSYLTTSEDLIHSYSISSELIESDFIKKSLMELYSTLYEDKIPPFILRNEEAPSEFVYVKSNLFGNLILLPFPKEEVKTANLRLEFFDSNAEVSCSCLSGSKGCTKKGMLGAKYCDAGDCRTCKLSD